MKFVNRKIALFLHEKLTGVQIYQRPWMELKHVTSRQTRNPASYTAMLDMTSLTVNHSHMSAVLSKGHGSLQTKFQIALVGIINDSLLFSSMYYSIAKKKTYLKLIYFAIGAQGSLCNIGRCECILRQSVCKFAYSRLANCSNRS